MSDGPFANEANPEQRQQPPPKLEGFVPAIRPRATRLARSHGWDAWLPLLNNRLVLSGLGLVVVLLLIAIVLVSIGRGDETPHRVVVAQPATAENGTALPRGGLTGRILTTASVRNGPDATYAILGTIPKGAVVAVIGRNTNESWLQIRYPPGSTLRGWVDAQFLDITGDISQLAIAGPGPSPAITLPAGSTAPIPTATEEEATPTEETTPSVTATPTFETEPTPTEGPEATATQEPKATPTAPPKATPTPAG